MEVPAFIAIYRSAKDFIGEDNFTLEVTGASGKFQLQRITVTVAAAGAGLKCAGLCRRVARPQQSIEFISFTHFSHTGRAGDLAIPTSTS
jgi:hypothetical protein